MTEGQLILAAGALLAAGVGASLLAARVRLPGLVLFLGLGMVIGSDVTGLVPFEDYEVTRTVGTIALALILFEGGLSAGLREIRPVLAPATSLAIVGTIGTAVITGLGAAFLLGLTPLQGLLLGAVLSSTDGAAIFAVLRGSTLRRKLARTLEGEAGLNDPVAVLLVLGFIEWLQRPDYGLADMSLLFAQELGLGLLVGVAVGLLFARVVQRIALPTPGLYPVLSLAAAALAFGAADSLGASGFLAIYLAGLLLGSGAMPAQRTVAAFHEGLGWVAQLTMFFTLGLLVFPSELDDVALEGAAVALLLALVARPLATAVALSPFRYNVREQALVGWAGLRGAVPVVLATFPVIAGIPASQEFFNVVFFAVVFSTVLQGATFEPIARRLGLTRSGPALPRPLAESGTIQRLGAEVLEFPVAPRDAVVGARIRDLGLPREAVVNVIVREDQAIPPRGSTRVMAGDELHVLLRREFATEVRGLLDRWRTGPIGRPERPPRALGARASMFSTWRWREETEGDPSRPNEVRGIPVIEQLRLRRDQPGGLWVVEDGRYAITGAVAALGARRQVADWARRRAQAGDPDERAWLQTVIGALATDAYE